MALNRNNTNTSNDLTGSWRLLSGHMGDSRRTEDQNSNRNESSSRLVISSSTVTSQPRTEELYESTTSEQSSLMSASSMEDEGRIAVVVLDTRQRKFRVMARPDWTVAQFKECSEVVHKVPASSQRLIYMGKLLQDSQTLRESNISQPECIVHLFPKPNVVLLPHNAASSTDGRDGALCGAVTDGGGHPTSTHRTTTASGNQATQTDTSPEDVSAHIPQIVIDQESMNHSYTIFTSNELFEAQHRVKLLSFILLIISSMELLTLFTIFVAPPIPENNSDDNTPPGDPTDYTNPTASSDIQYRPWRHSDYIDLIVSMAGVYVALLGLRASTENSVIGSKQYFITLLVVGIMWLGYYFYIGLIKQEEDRDKQQEEDANNHGNATTNNTAQYGNIYVQTLVSLTLPIAVWIICFYRAWQFRSLLLEAQREAEERHIYRDATINESNDGNELRLTASIV